MQYFIRNGYLIAFYCHFHIINLKTRQQYLLHRPYECLNYTINGNTLSRSNFIRLMLTGFINDISVEDKCNDVDDNNNDNNQISLRTSMTCGFLEFDVHFSDIPMVSDSEVNTIYDCGNSTYVLIFGIPDKIFNHRDNVHLDNVHLLYIHDKIDEHGSRTTFVSDVINKELYDECGGDNDKKKQYYYKISLDNGRWYSKLEWNCLLDLLHSVKFEKSEGIELESHFDYSNNYEDGYCARLWHGIIIQDREFEYQTVQSKLCLDMTLLKDVTI